MLVGKRGIWVGVVSGMGIKLIILSVISIKDLSKEIAQTFKSRT